MKAMLLQNLAEIQEDSEPLQLAEVEKPQAGDSEILIRVKACAVCHTELDEIENRTPPPSLPVIPGHQVIGVVEACGNQANQFQVGDRVGVAWIASACGQCDLCRSGNENLCAEFKATGRDCNGGYAEYMAIDEAFAYSVPEIFTEEQAAPLLCAGAIGYRSMALTGLKNGESLGLTGFGASAHLVLKMVQHQYPDSKVYVFARQQQEQEFALELGAAWAGPTEAQSPELLKAIIDTTPAWLPIREALKNLQPTGRLVINAIRKEEADKQALLSLDYPKHLWQEKEIKSVANVTREDVRAFLKLAAEIPIMPETKTYSLEQANQALRELKFTKIKGAKVLIL